MAFEPSIPPIQVHLCVRGGKQAIAWYERAFGAVETYEQLADDGERVMHANLAVFGSEVMLHDEFPEHGGDVLSPLARGGAALSINVNLPTPSDVDRAVRRASEEGAAVTQEPTDAFWGARYARIVDPFGHVWAFNAPLGKQEGK